MVDYKIPKLRYEILKNIINKNVANDNDLFAELQNVMPQITKDEIYDEIQFLKQDGLIFVTFVSGKKYLLAGVTTEGRDYYQNLKQNF